jgi:hypothetical protein
MVHACAPLSGGPKREPDQGIFILKSKVKLRIALGLILHQIRFKLHFSPEAYFLGFNL